jgi:hypothetical protein
MCTVGGSTQVQIIKNIFGVKYEQEEKQIRINAKCKRRKEG